MSSLDDAWAMAAKLEAAGAPLATADPRSATPPCILIEPPSGPFPTSCSMAAEWRVIALAPGTANVDAWAVLEELQLAVIAVLPVEARSFGRYSLALDSPPMPAFLFTFTQSVEV